ncbi:MAG: exonuclease SbcCD subunit D C-terminal domain-containing protein, partial [Deltaproteobacteria bacterium]|nr:exonuclease SbcCD subunit D C-terminal domain-containing protein [Deltaproteobacteria bacterium]
MPLDLDGNRGAGQAGEGREPQESAPAHPPVQPGPLFRGGPPAQAGTSAQPGIQARPGSPSQAAPETPSGPRPNVRTERKLVLDEKLERPSLQGPRFRFIHTSDWHLGKRLDTVERHEEFRAFLEWLLALADSEKPDALIVAGDIFDVHSPPVWAQQLYYRFMRDAMRMGLSVVVTSGNHDSQQFLEAPRPVLRALGIHVSALPRADPADELVLLEARDGGGPAAIVAAVPFLREHDVRPSVEGESLQEEGRGIAAAVTARYEASAAAATALQDAQFRSLGRRLPLVAVGHLMAVGAIFHQDDGIRKAYAGERHGPDGAAGEGRGVRPQAAGRGAGETRVGSVWGVNTGPMGELFDYTALGHIHRPQRAGAETVRYSGSPIPLRFSEADTEKSVTLVETGGGGIRIECLAVPRFRDLERVEGTLAEVKERLRELVAAGSNAVVEVSVKGSPFSTSLTDEVDAIVRDSLVEVTSVRNVEHASSIRARSELSSALFLKEMDERDVFLRLLDQKAKEIGDRRDDLILAYEELLESLDEEDPGGEPRDSKAPAPKPVRSPPASEQVLPSGGTLGIPAGPGPEQSSGGKAGAPAGPGPVLPPGVLIGIPATPGPEPSSGGKAGAPAGTGPELPPGVLIGIPATPGPEPSAGGLVCAAAGHGPELPPGVLIGIPAKPGPEPSSGGKAGTLAGPGPKLPPGVTLDIPAGPGPGPEQSSGGKAGALAGPGPKLPSGVTLGIPAGPGPEQASGGKAGTSAGPGPEPSSGGAAG